MTVKEAKDLLKKPKFGNAWHIKAVELLDKVEKMGGLGTVIECDCEDCEGSGVCGGCNGSGAGEHRLTENSDAEMIDDLFKDFYVDTLDD